MGKGCHFYGLKICEVDQPLIAGIILDLVSRIVGLLNQHFLGADGSLVVDQSSQIQ